MKKRLLLMRHAKSDWSDGSLSDHDRPLNARGRRSVPVMVDWLDDQGFLPDLILLSSSERTRETVELMLQMRGQRQSFTSTDNWTVETRVLRELYLATNQQIVDSVCRFGCQADCLLALAHNPGISALATRLAGQVIEMPTGAIAAFDVELQWWDEWAVDLKAELVDFAKPKDFVR